VHERSGTAVYGIDMFAALDDLLELADGTVRNGRPALEDSAVHQEVGELATRVYVNAAMVNLAKSRVLHGRSRS